MPKKIEIVQKYVEGMEVKTLVGKTIKEGFVFSNSYGIVRAFNSKTSLYTVGIKTISGEEVKVDYDETEIILKDLTIEKTNSEIEKTQTEINALLKKNKLICSAGIVIVLLAVAAAIIVSLNTKERSILVTTFIIDAAVVLIAGLIMYVLSSKNGKIINKKCRSLENIVLNQRENNLQSFKGNENESIIMSIQKLKGLLEDKAISEEEYESAKKKLLLKIK